MNQTLEFHIFKFWRWLNHWHGCNFNLVSNIFLGKTLGYHGHWLSFFAMLGDQHGRSKLFPRGTVNISKCLTILTYIEETESPNTEFPGTTTVTPYDQTTVTGIETPLTTATSGT